MTERRVVPFDTVDQPEPGMLYSDRLGPWFHLDGSEIIPVGTEVVERAVELIIGTFQLWSNLPKIDGTSVAIDFPLLTQLIQQDWERVMGGEAAGGCRSSTDSATADRTRGIPDVAL